MHMSSTVPETAQASPRTRTPEEAAAIIGGDCKASFLRALARDGKIPFVWLGKYAFTDAHIDEIVRYCERLPGKPAKAAAPAPAKKPAVLASVPAVTGVPQLRSRPRSRAS